MRIWFNKTFSSISSIFYNLRQAKDVGQLTIIASHTNAYAPALGAAHEAYVEPSGLVGAAYLGWCLKFCQEQRIDLFWVAKEARYLSNHKEKFAQIGTKLLVVATSEVLGLLNNKGVFYRSLPPEVALTMENISVRTKEEFDQAVAELSQRHASLCVKPAVSIYGLGFRILDTTQASITHLLQGIEYQIPLDELRAGMEKTPVFPELLIMENLNGHEWSVDCVGRQGQLICAIQRRKLAKGLGQVIDNDAEIQGMVERLTLHFQLNGIFNIQFKLGAQGPRLLEINARPSGGIGMACLAGVNLAELVLKSLESEVVAVPPIQYGRRVSELNAPVLLEAAS
ncbi:ATP-grasp domain-containing protein [uncultured Thiothrix sp.]|uniref:ATP-grasp domain-containing protein n=1 Tax=uncultured Thiothrix sp. TaxID=223185 RepID=UPI002629F9AD|nr:ATP-grasp domain-containing protein [uncultured Thiothrix sp.]HMT92038.1 ATP-grasp domain-containing protein [Thiolinea sp.]